MFRKSLMCAVLILVTAGSVLAATTTIAPQVNINTATVQELQCLPRVGPALAQRILEFRTANGAFKAPAELTRVKGIGEKTFALMQPFVTISGATTIKEKVRPTQRTNAE